MLQTKEQGKNLQDQINEDKIGNLPKKEFRIMIVNMIQNLRNRVEKIQETFNKDLEELKRKQTGTNNTISEIKNTLGLPWRRNGWESACWCKGHGFGPWSRRIPHAAERLGPWATTAEPARLELVLHSRGGHDSGRPAHRDEEWPLLATAGGVPRAETGTKHSQK